MCVPVGRQATGRVLMNNTCVCVRACWMKCSLRVQKCQLVCMCTGGQKRNAFMYKGMCL